VLSGDELEEKNGFLFDLDDDDQRDATKSNPLPVLGLPTIHAATDSTAWIASICVDPADEGDVVDCKPANPLAARQVTIEARGRAGAVTKTIQATYTVGLSMSDIFRYAYFLNNYGWMEAPAGTQILIHGEVRSNGDLQFSGLGSITVNGDLYASENSAVYTPTC